MATPGLLSETRQFILRSPEVPTLIQFASRHEREDYSRRIMQRLGISVEEYAILNLHRIVVNAPTAFVFEQLQTWNGSSSWWPNRIARLEAADRRLELVRVYFLGRKRPLLGLRASLFGLNVVPLFEMQVLNVRAVPLPEDEAEGRFMLYRCRGGYPAGVVAIYLRPAAAHGPEAERTRVYFGVGFNFYGRDDWPERHWINSVWERIHNRVTGNVLNRLKGECETRYR